MERNTQNARLGERKEGLNRIEIERGWGRAWEGNEEGCGETYRGKTFLAKGLWQRRNVGA